MFSAAELAEMYAETGEPVTVQGDATPRFGQFSEAGQLEFDGEIVATEPALRFAVQNFPSMPRGTRLSVSGRTWKTRTAPRLLSDGLEAVVALEEVQP